MARLPLETTRLIVEATSYITIRYTGIAACAQLCHFSNYFAKYSCSVFFFKLGKLEKEVISTRRKFQIFGSWKRTVNLLRFVR